MATNPNVADRHDQTFFTGPMGNGTVITGPSTIEGPSEFLNADGEALTVAAAATDTTTAIALANSLRTQLIALGVVVSA